MVPSLNKSQIDVAELSKELQLVNDTNAAKLDADFQYQADGTNRKGKRADRLTICDLPARLHPR